MTRRALRIEDARSGDEAAIDHLALEAGLQVDARAQLSMAHSRILLARQDDSVDRQTIVGFLLIVQVADELQIVDLAVKSSHRRRMVATSLIERALCDARRAGVTQAFLEVRAGNLPAIALYGRCGFAPWDRRSRYYPDGEDALIFRCCLAAKGPADSKT